MSNKPTTNGTQVIAPPMFDPALAQTLADAAKEVQTNERMESNFFSTKGGHLSFGGMAVPNNRMNVIVMAALHENQWYEKPFDGNNPCSPDCWAFSETGTGMAPIPGLVSKLQSPTCDACPKSAWGSGMKNGQPSKGKACKQMRRLALMPSANAKSAQGVMDGVVGILRVPVMSVKNWAQYAQKLALLSVPPFAAFTEVASVPDPHSLFAFTFTLTGYVNDPAVLEAIMKRVPAERLALATPYGKNSDAEEATVPNAAAAAALPAKF